VARTRCVPKALETLLLVLIEHRDGVLTKDELLQRIWVGGAVKNSPCEVAQCQLVTS
jgi:DNA-binding winged helix-turn-helix (wHTH) protein